MPQASPSWRPVGDPARLPAEYARGGTAKLLTLFRPATGEVRAAPVRSGSNAVLHPWLKDELAAILAALPPAPGAAADRACWEAWQAGLSVRFTLPAELPPPRALLVWDNLTGHKTPELVLWLCAHGVMPLYTPLGGSWLNMAEAEIALLSRRALDQRLPDADAVRRALAAWERPRNDARATVSWRFTVKDARRKLKRVYPARPA